LKFTPYPIDYNTYEQWSGLTPENSYTNVHPTKLAGLLPSGLLPKCQPGMIMASASGDSTIFVANLNRVDIRDSAIDQQPIIAIFNHTSALATGGFLEHGNWSGRTYHPGEGFFAHIRLSGTGARYPLSQIPFNESGSLEELAGSSNELAFRYSVSALQHHEK